MPSPRLSKFNRVLLWTVVAPLALLLLAGFMKEDSPARERLNLAYASVTSLKKSLLEPGNLHFDDVRITDAGAACFRYRARDRFGAESHAQAVVRGRDVVSSNDRDGRFDQEWDRQCTGLAFDATSAVDRFF